MMKKFKDTLKYLRRSKRISQEELATKLSVHQTAISQWETGRTMPDIETLINIADVFCVSVDYLLGNNAKADEKPKLGSNIQRFRSIVGLNKDDIATLIGVPVEKVASWEQESEKPTVAELMKLSSLFCIAPNALFGVDLFCKYLEKHSDKSLMRETLDQKNCGIAVSSEDVNKIADVLGIKSYYLFCLLYDVNPYRIRDVDDESIGIPADDIYLDYTSGTGGPDKLRDALRFCDPLNPACFSFLAPEVQKVVEDYLSLDEGHQGEIRGEIRQMKKDEAQSKQEEAKRA